MKRILSTISIFACGLLLLGCTDFLDVKKYHEAKTWETEDDITKAIAALYSFTSNNSEGVTGTRYRVVRVLQRQCDRGPSPSRGRADPQFPDEPEQRTRRENHLERDVRDQRQGHQPHQGRSDDEPVESRPSRRKLPVSPISSADWLCSGSLPITATAASTAAFRLSSIRPNPLRWTRRALLRW